MTIIFDGTQGITTPAETANNSVTTPVVKSGSSLVFQSNGTTEAMRIDTSQRVGIGITNPGASLDVKTNIFITENSVASSNTELTLLSRFSDNQRGYVILKAESNSSGSSDLVVRSRNNFSEAEKFRIDSVGRVTMPSQPFFYARKTTNQTIATGTTVEFNTTTTNIGSHYNTSTYRFTAPIAGVYSFSAKVWMGKNGGSYGSFDPRVNGSLIPNSAGAYYDGSINSTGLANYIVNFQYSLNVSDYVDFTVGGNANLVLDNSGYFCGFLVS